MREQLAEDLKLKGGAAGRSEEEVLRALLERIPHHRNKRHPPQMLPLAMELLVLSDQAGRGGSPLLGEIGLALQRQWQRSSRDRAICSRKMGVNSDGDCPFLVFSMKGAASIVQGMLAACGDDMSAKLQLLLAEDDEKFPPLHCACYGGCSSIVELCIELLDLKALNAQADDGFSPLMLAACFGHADCVRLLLAAKVDVNLRLSKWNKVAKMGKGETALSMARKKGHAEAEALLMEAGARATQPTTAAQEAGLAPRPAPPSAALATAPATAGAAALAASSSALSHSANPPTNADAAAAAAADDASAADKKKKKKPKKKKKKKKRIDESTLVGAGGQGGGAEQGGGGEEGQGGDEAGEE